MSPPSRDEVAAILEEGRPKYGWMWMKGKNGYWWGAQRGSSAVLQVKPEPPDFPTRKWHGGDDAHFTPSPKWESLSMFVDRTTSTLRTGNGPTKPVGSLTVKPGAKFGSEPDYAS